MTNKPEPTTIKMIYRAILEVLVVLAIPGIPGGIYWLLAEKLSNQALLFKCAQILWVVFFILLFFGPAKLFYQKLLKPKNSSKPEKLLTLLYNFLPNKLYYIFLLRVPIISGLILFSFPLIAQFVAPNFLQNIFVMDNGVQLITVMVLSTFSAVIIISLLKTIITTIVDEGIGENFNKDKRFRIRRAVWTLCLFLPTWIVLLYLNNEKTNIENIEWIYRFFGIFIGILPLIIAELYEYKSPISEKLLENVQKNNLLKRFKKNNLLKRFKELEFRRFLIFSIQILFGIVFYIAVIIRNWPPNNSDPTLLYVLLIIWVLTLFAGSITLGFDLSIDKRLDDEKKELLNFDSKSLKSSSLEKETSAEELGKKMRLYNHTFYWPVILFLILFSSLGYGAFNVDHYFKLEDSQVLIKDYQQNFQEAIWNRLCDQEFEDKTQTCNNNKEESLVVVSASGGGIQASGWMTQVLAGLQEDKTLGKNFTKSIGLISSASGGSVGSMFYLNQFDENGVLSQKGLEKKDGLAKVVENATDDWLNSVGWGLAYPDLFRSIGLPFLIKQESGGDDKPYLYLDRGYALEKTWEKTLKGNKASQAKMSTLDDWRILMLDGNIPISVYNTTLVENGRRFLVSPMKFVPGEMTDYVQKTSKNNQKALDFKTLYNNCGENDNRACDLAVTTASRLSASFPYVTPMPRNDRENCIIKNKDEKCQALQNYHIADGGFFDNSGAFTAMEWLNKFLKYNYDLKNKDHYINIKKVILLQINAFPEDELKTNQGGSKGFEVVTLGPLNTLAGIRESTQIERNQKIGELLEERWLEKGIEIKDFTISFPKSKQEGDQNIPYNPPLSWRLTKRQKDNLKDAWEKDKTINDTVECMRDFWNKGEMNNECENLS